MAGNGSTYESSGPSAPQTARAVLAELPTQVKGFGDEPAFLLTRNVENPVNPNTGLVIQSRAPGASAITVAFVAAGNNTPLTVGVVSNAITVNLATNAAGGVASTAAQVRDAINTTAASNALVAAAVSEGDGSGIVGTFAATALAGNATANVGVLSDAPLPKQHAIYNSYVGSGGRG